MPHQYSMADHTVRHSHPMHMDLLQVNALACVPLLTHDAQQDLCLKHLLLMPARMPVLGFLFDSFSYVHARKVHVDSTVLAVELALLGQ